MEQLALRAWLRYPVGGFSEERKENSTEDLVFLENLVDVEALSVAKRTELHRLGNNGHIGADFVYRVLQVISDALNQKRYVIEQLIRREDLVLIERDSGGDALQPPRGQLPSGLTEPFC